MRVFSIFFSLFFLTEVSSQIRLIHYTKFNGLPHDITYGLHQDNKGYIWVGTDNGVAKFDGAEFETLNINEGLTNNFVIDVTQDEQNSMFFATWGGGLNRLKSNKITTNVEHKLKVEKLSKIFKWNDLIISPNPKTNYFSIFFNQDKKLYQSIKYLNINSKDSVWISKNSLNSFRKVNVNLTTIDNKLILYNSPYNRENVKVLKGVYVYKNDLLELWKPFLSAFEINNILKLTPDKYLAFSKKKILIFNNNKILLEKPFSIEGKKIVKSLKLSSNKILTLAMDSKGYKTCFLLDKDVENPKNISTIINSNIPISDFIEDTENNIWISTYGNGIYCIVNNENFQSYKPEIFNTKEIVDINFDKRSMHILTKKNFFSTQFNKNSFTTYDLKGTSISFINKEEQIFIGSNNIREEYINLSERIIQRASIKYLKNKRFDVNIKKNELNFLDTTIVIEDRVTINDCIFKDDEIWLGTSNGIYIYSHKFEMEKRLDKSDGILSNNIIQILKKKGKVYIATDRGLSIIQENKIYNYTEKEGLINNQINAIFEYNNTVLIGTSDGLSVLRNDNFINFNDSSGLNSSFITCIAKDQNNKFWIGTNKGISTLNSLAKLKKSKPPLIYVNKNGLVFKAKTVSLDRPKNVKIQYTTNHIWQDINYGEEFNIGKLRKGDYSIQFRAKKIDSDWAYSDRFSIKIDDPWYKKSHIIFLLTILCSLPIVVIYYSQLKKTKRRNEKLKFAMDKQKELENNLAQVRENIAQDFHDELGNIAAGISIMADKARVEIEKNNKDHALIATTKRISNDANKLYEGIRDFIWAIDDKNHSLKELIIYLTDFGLEFFEESDINFKVDNKIKNHSIILPNYWNRQILLIFREAFLNSVKHSTTKEAKLIFNLVNNILIIRFLDKGKGFDQDLVLYGNGLKNMKSRAEKINCEIIVNSSKSGTEIIFRGKLNI